MLITQALAATAQKNLVRPSYRYLDKEHHYRELQITIARLSYLYTKEFGQGNRIAFLARNCPAYITTFFAMANTRSVSIPIDPERSDEEIAAWLKDSDATHIAVSNDLLSRVKEIMLAFHLNLPVIEMEKKHGGEYDTSFTAASDAQPAETDTILMFRTAGITGKPKFVNYTHKQLSFATNLLRRLYHFNLTDRFLSKLSWAHPFAFMHHMFFPLLNGGVIVIDHGLEAADFLDFMVHAHTTRLLGTPQFFQKLILTCRSEQRTLPAAVKSATIVGGLMPPDYARVMGLMKVAVTHCYGMTENLWTIGMQDTTPEGEQGFAVMRPLAGIKYKVLDDSGDVIEGPDKRTGLLAISGPTVMSGYYELEKETKNALRGTWLYTGDIATLEGDGEELRITLIGRKSDLFRDEMEHFVSMDHINQTLKNVPGVEDAAAFVTKTSLNAPVIACAIVRAGNSTLNEKHILSHCQGNMPAEQVPHAITFTDYIPKDFGGNPNYTKLRGQFSGIAG